MRNFINVGAPEPAMESLSRHERNMLGNRRFVLAMIIARRRGLERFTLGIDGRPGTERPRFVNRNEHGVPMESILTGF